MELQRVVAANRDTIIANLIEDQKVAIAQYAARVAQINADLKHLGFKKVRGPKTATAPAKERRG